MHHDTMKFLLYKYKIMIGIFLVRYFIQIIILFNIWVYAYHNSVFGMLSLIILLTVIIIERNN